MKNPVVIDILAKPFNRGFDHVIDGLIIGWLFVKIIIDFPAINPQGNLPNHQLCFNAALLTKFYRMLNGTGCVGWMIGIIQVFFLRECMQ